MREFWEESKWLVIAIGATIVFIILVAGGTYLYEETGPGGYLTDTPQMDAVHVSRMEAKGKDIRIYEFRPKIDADRVCVFVVGNKKGGLQCWRKDVAPE